MTLIVLVQVPTRMSGEAARWEVTPPKQAAAATAETDVRVSTPRLSSGNNGPQAA
jgi:hypothetical protein